METHFLVQKNFEKRNIYSGYLCEVKKEEEKLVIRALYPVVGSLQNDIFFDFESQKEYKQIKIEDKNKEEGIYFIYPEKLYVKKIENIPGIKINPLDVFRDYEIKDPEGCSDIKRRVRKNDGKHDRFI